MSSVPSFDFSLSGNHSNLYEEPLHQSFSDPFKTNNHFSASSHNQWSTSNNQYQFNQYIQRIQALEETVTKLQIEIKVIEAARSTLQHSYDTLVGQLRTNTNAGTSSQTIDVAFQCIPAPPDLPPLPQFKRDDYPLLRFWAPKTWKEWNESPEGQYSKLNDKNHNMKYLEDEKGRALDHTRVSNILNCMRDVWHGFRKQNLIDANTTWTTMSLALKKVLRHELAKSHPETNLGEDGWKIDRLAKDHYSSFKQTWFTNKTEEKRAAKRKIKYEGDAQADINSVTDREQSRPAAKRPRCKSVSPNSFAALYDDDSFVQDPLQDFDDTVPRASSTTDESVASSSSTNKTGSSASANESLVSPSISNKPIRSRSHSDGESVVSSSLSSKPETPSAADKPIGSSNGTNETQSAADKPITPSTHGTNETPSAVDKPIGSSNGTNETPSAADKPITSSNGTNETPSSSDKPIAPSNGTNETPSAADKPIASSNGTNETPSAVDESTATNVLGSPGDSEDPPVGASMATKLPRNVESDPKLFLRIKNPLLLSKASRAKTGTGEQHAESSKTPPTNGNLPLLPAVQLNTDSTTVTATVTPVPTTTKKGWRPAANKTGRTLCAHRWLKQLKPEGSKEEFDAYYQTITAEAKARYKDEAAKLVADSTWSKGTADIIAKIAVLPMH